MKRKLFLSGMILALALALLFSGVSLAASGYDLSWWTVDAGGGASGAGNYRLQGTLGQADAGLLSGGNYRLAGGFWPGGEGAEDIFNLYLPVIVRDWPAASR